MTNITQLRESITPEEIKNILFDKYGVSSINENHSCIVFPTCCHNLNGGSAKLYYYKNTHLFVCYTKCAASFDIFELIIKMEALRGREISLLDAIEITGRQKEYLVQDEDFQRAIRQAEYIRRINNTTLPEIVDNVELNETVLDQYSSNPVYLQPWMDEGMSPQALSKFGIKYDMNKLAIVIPHRDKNGKLIGVRGRFMSEDAPNKYMPLTSDGKYLAHPLKDNLYGLYENKEAIKRKDIAIIFEAEKSVILFETYFGKENCAVATCGNKISTEQIMLLRELGVTEVCLCYDKDYHNYEEMVEVRDHYFRVAEKLSNYFTTSIVMDYGKLLNYKDSPADRGLQTFNKLFEDRYYL